MPSSDIEAFLDKLKEDKDLQAKLTNIEDPEKILAIANDAGFGLTMDDVSQMLANEKNQDLSDDDLEEIAGGNSAVVTLFRTCACSPRRTINTC